LVLLASHNVLILKHWFSLKLYNEWKHDENAMKGNELNKRW